MAISFNSNMKLLIGGSYAGGESWNKGFSELDKCFKIYYFRQGEASIEGNSGIYKLEPNNLYFINGYALKHQKCIRKIEVDWIHFNPESVYLKYVLKYTPCVINLNVIEFVSFRELYSQFDSFFSEQKDDKTKRILILQIQSLIELVLANVFKRTNYYVLQDNANMIRLLPSMEFINLNYCRQLTLKEISDVCYLSPNYFHRIFTKTFEKTPFDCILQLRMEEAVRQLVYANKPVREVAFAVGYEDEAYFSRAFSKYYKISPGRYRNMHKKILPQQIIP
jgi:AraC-like DNA-binding protein